MRAESEAGLMRFLAFFARHPWPRNGLVLIAAAAVLCGGVRLWTSGPDAVHITITHVDGSDGTHPVIKTVTFDRTIHNGEVAQRLQRDLAALPLIGPFATYNCFVERSIYDSYTLTWYRAGLPVEQASASRMGCAMWNDDNVFTRAPVNVDAFYADIDAAAAAGG